MFDHGFQAHSFRKIKPAEEKATGISWALLARVPVPLAVKLMAIGTPRLRGRGGENWVKVRSTRLPTCCRVKRLCEKYQKVRILFNKKGQITLVKNLNAL